MGSCCSSPSPGRKIAGRRITDDYEFDEFHYYGDQSWQDFHDIGNYYTSEFQPENVKRKTSKNRWSIRSKIESIRRSFFNVAHEPDQIFKDTTTKEESKKNMKERLSGWRKSLLGDKSPGPIRKLSAYEARQEAMDPDPAQGLSKGGKNRLNVTKNFVTKHAEPEAVYHRQPKSPTTPKRISFLDQIRPASPVEVQAVITPPPNVAVKPPRFPSPTPKNIVMEETIVPDEVRKESLQQEIDVMQKIQDLNRNTSDEREDEKSKQMDIAEIRGKTRVRVLPEEDEIKQTEVENVESTIDYIEEEGEKAREQDKSDRQRKTGWRCKETFEPPTEKYEAKYEDMQIHSDGRRQTDGDIGGEDEGVENKGAKNRQNRNDDYETEEELSETRINDTKDKSDDAFTNFVKNQQEDKQYKTAADRTDEKTNAAGRGFLGVRLREDYRQEESESDEDASGTDEDDTESKKKPDKAEERPKPEYASTTGTVTISSTGTNRRAHVTPRVYVGPSTYKSYRSSKE